MADEKRADDKKADKKEDMTPQPTQAQLDELAGEAGKKEKAEREKAAASRKQEDLTPQPTQKENDEFKAALFNTTVEKDKERQKEYLEPKAKSAKDAKDAEDLTPTPTQAEHDAFKKAVMYEPEDNPGGGTDPQKAKHEDAKHEPQHRRQIEAKPAPAAYETRTMAKAD
jgi:hypothetical protein